MEQIFEYLPEAIDVIRLTAAAIQWANAAVAGWRHLRRPPAPVRRGPGAPGDEVH